MAAFKLFYSLLCDEIRRAVLSGLQVLTRFCRFRNFLASEPQPKFLKKPGRSSITFAHKTISSLKLFSTPQWNRL
jgi:hypothetical protein